MRGRAPEGGGISIESATIRRRNTPSGPIDAPVTGKSSALSESMRDAARAVVSTRTTPGANCIVGRSQAMRTWRTESISAHATAPRFIGSASRKGP